MEKKKKKKTVVLLPGGERAAQGSGGRRIQEGGYGDGGAGARRRIRRHAWRWSANLVAAADLAVRGGGELGSGDDSAHGGGDAQ